MDLDEYQKKAGETDQYHGDSQRGVSIPLFGLIGEIGSLLTTFKKRLRDKSAYTRFPQDIKEEMGDVLWYIANLAKKYNLTLNEIAEFNLQKTKALWPTHGLDLTSYRLYDEEFPANEQLQRELEVHFVERSSTAGLTVAEIFVNGKQIGDRLTDNAYDENFYRYHDSFHLAYAAILGWSPVLRKMTNRKRKSNQTVDEVEDGARALIAEELISLFVYRHAQDHKLFEGIAQIDTEILKTIRNLSMGFEVSNRSAHEWKTAIFKGYEIFRYLIKNRGGIVKIDLKKRSIEYQKPEKT